MPESLSIQLAFILFESVFCFVVAFYTFIKVVSADKKNEKNRLLMVGNFLAAMILFFDFFSYVSDGQPGAFNFVMIRLSNFMLFFLTALILFTYSLYVSFQLFGNGGLTSNNPAKIPLRVSYIVFLLDALIPISNIFIPKLFYVDENNIYHRDVLFYASITLSTIGLIAIIIVLITYRKRFEKTKFLTLLSIGVLPAIGMLFQIAITGISSINISIGFALILMFIENSVSQSKELIRISKLEVRTGLFNEHGCIEKLNDLRDYGKNKDFAVVFFDICKFSDINRKYGMKAGDKVLKNYAEKLNETLKDDEFLGRQGSDHYIGVVRKKNLKNFLNLLSETEIEFTYGVLDEKNARIYLSSVAGVYEIEDEDIKGEDAIANAYTALLYAKTVSKQPVDYMTQELKDRIDQERQFGSILFEGIGRDEFSAYYQPKVNIDKHELCGAEALARWNHEGEIIPPGDFIPIMEKNDSVCALDFYILAKVCKDISGWSEEGLDIPVISVNFSRRNLSNKNLAKDIDKVVQSHNVPKGLIEIEITETNDEFPIGVLKDFVDSLHELGYKVAVDDFGCGAASLSLLREADFDTLKIDKSFIDNAFEKDLTILSHIVNMAKAIDMKIVAEGVESKWQQDKLKELGVGVVQGFYFDKAVTKDEMVKRIQNKDYSPKE